MRILCVAVLAAATTRFPRSTASALTPRRNLNDGAVMPWSFAEERRFIEIAASSKSFDEVVKRTRRNPASVRKTALRLGVKLAKQNVSDNQLALGLKAKGK